MDFYKNTLKFLSVKISHSNETKLAKNQVTNKIPPSPVPLHHKKPNENVTIFLFSMHKCWMRNEIENLIKRDFPAS